jgi:antitoxin VapB
VRLPKEFRLPGGRVRVRRVGGGVPLEPTASDVDAWFAELDRFADVPLFEDGRNQPLTPADEDVFE